MFSVFVSALYARCECAIMVHTTPRTRGHKPPMLKPLAQEGPTEGLGVQISDKGTLRISLQNGEHVAVRPSGVVAEDEAAFNAKKDDESEPEVLGKIKWQDLKMGRVIGEGSQAKVRKVKHRTTGTIYALKVITLGKQVTKRTLQQELARVLAVTNHPNVVASADAFYIDGALKVPHPCARWSEVSREGQKMYEWHIRNPPPLPRTTRCALGQLQGPPPLPPTLCGRETQKSMF